MVPNILQSTWEVLISLYDGNFGRYPPEEVATILSARTKLFNNAISSCTLISVLTGFIISATDFACGKVDFR